MKPLKLINPDREVTRQQIAKAEIEQSHREWIGINGKPWQPFKEPQKNPPLVTDEVLKRTLYILNPQEESPFLRRLWRWMRGR